MHNVRVQRVEAFLRMLAKVAEGSVCELVVA
jgi:hypothetical protein